MKPEEKQAALKLLLQPFIQANEPVAYVTQCCGNLFVGVLKPGPCKTCLKVLPTYSLSLLQEPSETHLNAALDTK